MGEGKTISKYRKDQFVFSQGEGADAIFYIQQGKVKLTVVSEQGKEAVNLDRKSTNHAHADFWLATKDNSLQGPKHSINVLSDVIMLYKAGASGRSLGAIDKFGTPELNALLASAAEEFGQLMQEASV